MAEIDPAKNKVRKQWRIDIWCPVKDLTDHFDRRFNNMEQMLLGKMKSMLDLDIREVRKDFDDKIDDVNEGVTLLREEQTN